MYSSYGWKTCSRMGRRWLQGVWRQLCSAVTRAMSCTWHGVQHVHLCFWGQPAVPGQYLCKLLWPKANAIQRLLWASTNCFTLSKKIAGNGFQLVEMFNIAYQVFCCSSNAQYLHLLKLTIRHFQRRTYDGGKVLSIWFILSSLHFVHIITCLGGMFINSFG